MLLLPSSCLYETGMQKHLDIACAICVRCIVVLQIMKLSFNVLFVCVFLISNLGVLTIHYFNKQKYKCQFFQVYPCNTTTQEFPIHLEGKTATEKSDHTSGIPAQLCGGGGGYTY